MQKEQEIAVSVRNLTKTYGKGESAVQALRGVDIEFTRGTFTAIMGQSGSGKSTFLQCTAGLDRPSVGTVTIGAQDITKLSENKLTKFRRKQLGFIFQSYNLMPYLTVTQNVQLPMQLAGAKVQSATINDILTRVGLLDRKKHLPSQLSGGQQQRVAIARALATNPDVIFADEPTGALDSATSKTVLTMLREAVTHDRQTVIMVTHDPVAASYADHVVFLADGRIAGSLNSPTPQAIANWLAQLGA